MASTVDAVGEPIPTSAVLMASSKHIATKCRMENVAFINCKKKDANPEKCLDKGQEVTRCVLSLSALPSLLISLFSIVYVVDKPVDNSETTVMLKGLHQRCTKEMDAYAGCMYYNTNEFDLCRKEQQPSFLINAAAVDVGIYVFEGFIRIDMDYSVGIVAPDMWTCCLFVLLLHQNVNLLISQNQGYDSHSGKKLWLFLFGKYNGELGDD
ncbi:hypothetical protein HHK36_012519 [Tetracentron sinense]|uniref:Uncharacterized protein n=1 Tax=Tetracentron sinense TaxID=13715 RepID=A0A834Z9F2_TETSI|nr:hypothetical protein HHK36_012519 [Tetracentron sinense]